MATSNLAYAASSGITITLNSLANNSARQSAVVDNSTNKYLDALVGGTFKTATGTLASPGYINVYAYALTDGTNYSGGASGSDAAYTLPTYKQLVLLGTVYINTANVVENMSPKSVAAAFGGTLPQKWGIVVENQSGLTLDASAGGALSYTGITVTTA